MAKPADRRMRNLCPRGIIFSEEFLLTPRAEVPLIQEALTGVVFLDTGTVTDDPGLDEYRSTIGAGIRIYIPQFGPVPIAFDLAIPIEKQAGDRTQVLSFSVELPF